MLSFYCPNWPHQCFDLYLYSSKYLWNSPPPKHWHYYLKKNSFENFCLCCLCCPQGCHYPIDYQTIAHPILQIILFDIKSFKLEIGAICTMKGVTSYWNNNRWYGHSNICVIHPKSQVFSFQYSTPNILNITSTRGVVSHNGNRNDSCSINCSPCPTHCPYNYP